MTTYPHFNATAASLPRDTILATSWTSHHTETHHENEEAVDNEFAALSSPQVSARGRRESGFEGDEGGISGISFVSLSGRRGSNGLSMPSNSNLQLRSPINLTLTFPVPDLSNSFSRPGSPTPIPTPHQNSRRHTTESSPLLGSRRRESVTSAAHGVEISAHNNPRLHVNWGWKNESKVLVEFTIPIFLTHVLEFTLLAVTVVSLGHLGTEQLAGASLATMTSNVICFSIIQGMCCALDTLCPQAFTSSNPKLTSLHAMRMALILVALMIPQFILLWNAESGFLVLGQDPKVAHFAGRYLKVVSFGVPGYAGFEVVRRYLQAQGLMTIPTICVIVTAPINVLLNWLLVYGSPLGFIGAPLATVISMTLMFLISIVYCIFWVPRTALGSFTTKEILNSKGLGLTFRMGLAGVGMLASEWWSWEIVALASSYLGPTALAAQSVLLTSASLLYQLPYALSAASAVRVGNLLGWYLPRSAQLSSRISLVFAIILALLNSTILFTNRHRWGYLFSDEEEVIAKVADVLPLVCLFQIADGLTGTAGGILRGAGLQNVGSLINLTAYYVVGLPLGFALTFSYLHMGLKGLWWGLTVALGYTGILSSIWVWNLNWDREAERGAERLRVGIEEDRKSILEDDA